MKRLALTLALVVGCRQVNEPNPTIQFALAADAILATRDTIINGVVLPNDIVDQLTTFMGALTDPRARNLDRVVPRRVPSGYRASHFLGQSIAVDH